MNYKFLLPILLLVFSCKPKPVVKETLLDVLPQDAALFLKINNLANFSSELKNNTVLQQIQKTKYYDDILEKTAYLNHIAINEGGVLGFYEVGKNKFEFIFTTKANLLDADLDKVTNKKIETLTYENKELTHVTITNQDFYLYKLEDLWVVASSKLLIENVVRTGKENKLNPVLEKLYNTSSKNTSASIFINLKTSQNIFKSALKESKSASVKHFADWLAIEFKGKPDELFLNGILLAKDSIKNYTSLLSNTTPVTSSFTSYTPKNIDNVTDYTFNNYETFLRNQKIYLDAKEPLDTGIKGVEQLSILQLKSDKAVMLTTFDSEALLGLIESIKIEENTYQGTTLIKLNNSNFISNRFNPLVKDFESNFCTVFENTYIFSETESGLQTIIANIKSGNTLSNDHAYNTTKDLLSNESSIQFYATKNGLLRLSELHGLDVLTESISHLDNSTVLAAQVTADANFYHANLVIKKPNITTTTKSVSPLFTLELSNDLATNPQFVKNHRNNSYEIVVQDTDNNLYLISSEGKVLWKKKLDGKIQGKIQQVDLYKNGKLQLAFTTNNQFLILDRNGEQVSNFNFKFEGGNLNPLAVFDYENNRNYRFLVTQGTAIYMYNSSASLVKGFTYTKSESPILQAPKHFRIGNKDYLVFQLANGSLKIKHRAGQDRIKLEEKIDFSSNEVYHYKDKFITTNKEGVLHLIDSKGKLAASNLKLGPNHGLDATSKTLVYMDDNTLSIRGKKTELELGVYEKPIIFYIDNKLYISVTDIQNQKIYLFDSQSKSIANFPVYGSSSIDLIDMDKDDKLEVVSKDQENSIILYKLN